MRGHLGTAIQRKFRDSVELALTKNRNWLTVALAVDIYGQYKNARLSGRHFPESIVNSTGIRTG